MPKIEVIKKTVHEVGNINHEYGSLLVGKTECGGYAWSIEANTYEKWELIPESLYLELVKFNIDPIQIGDKVKLNEIGIKAIIDNSTQWTYLTIAKLLARENNGTITALSLCNNLFVVEFGTATFYLSADMLDKIGGDDL